MTGKMLLPLVGGAPAGWVVSMAFFQTALLAGYCLSFLLGRLPVLYHGIGYLIFLALGALCLPAELATEYLGTIQQSPAMTVVKMLLFGVGLPFVAIAASGPTLQRLYSASKKDDAKDPYYLYAASNLGSFAGLLSYPFVVEPLLPLADQKTGWVMCYGLLAGCALLCTALIIRLRPSENIVVAQDATAKPPSWQTRALWLLYAMVPSSLIMGVTTKITTDVMSIPLIWVIPLSLYLLTLVMAFAKKPFMSLNTSDFMAFCMIASTIIFSIYRMPGHQIGDFGLGLIGFFFVCLSLHMRLAQTRPDIRYLTEFYLLMSLGGALGGAFNAFLAPVIFPSYWEYHIALLVGLWLVLQTQTSSPKIKTGWVLVTVALGTFGIDLYCAIILKPPPNINDTMTSALATLPYILSFCAALLIFHPRKLGILLLCIVIGNEARLMLTQLDRGRSFYGISRITEDRKPNGNLFRIYAHGTTIHGMQIVAPALSTTPISYYAPASPIGDIFTTLAPQNVAVMGLGAGMVACYTAPNRHFTYFEIDPTVVVMAKKWFSYLDTCEMPSIIIGDGRLAMAQHEGKFDLILLDAFSSDSIPIHLLTTEALGIYLAHLNPNGVIAFHISNRFFNLAPPIAAIAKAHHLTSKARFFQPSAESLKNLTAVASHYVIVSPKPETIAALDAKGWKTLIPAPDTPIWRDDYAHILSAMKPFKRPPETDLDLKTAPDVHPETESP